MSFARLIGLRVARHEGLRIRRNVGLRLARAERRLGERLGSSSPVFEILVLARLELLVVAAAFGARLEVRIVLPELLLRRRDQAEIMLGMLESSFPPRPDRPTTGRHAQAGDISRPRDWPFRGSSRRARWIHRPVSAGCGCDDYYYYYCCCCCCARACACCDDAADRFSWLAVQQLPLRCSPVTSHSNRRRAGTKFQALAPPAWWSSNVVRLRATIWSRLS